MKIYNVKEVEFWSRFLNMYCKIVVNIEICGIEDNRKIRMFVFEGVFFLFMKY